MVDGPAGFDEGPGEVNLLGRVLYSISVGELELPHIVFTRSRSGGDTTYSGPYESGLMALAAAEAECRLDHESGGRGDLTFHVAALYPALEAQDLYRTHPAPPHPCGASSPRVVLSRARPRARHLAAWWSALAVATLVAPWLRERLTGTGRRCSGRDHVAPARGLPPLRALSADEQRRPQGRP